MDSIDFIKVLLAILASEVTDIFLVFAIPERTKEELEIDVIRRSMVVLTRTIIIIASVSYKWPLSMCVSISVVLSILIIIIRMNNRTNLDNETNSNNEENHSY